MPDPILQKAKEIVNLPHLLREFYPHADFSGLNNERGGVIKDPHPDHQEENPSFSISRHANGSWMYNQFNGTRRGGDAINLLQDACNFSFIQARADLIRRSGLIDAPDSRQRSKKSTKASSLDNSRSKVAHHPPAREADLKGWMLITASMAAGAPERTDFEARGLWNAIRNGRLKAFFWNAGGGKPRQRKIQPDALLIEIVGPDGKPIAYKARNRGSKTELKQKGLDRYVYLGTPGTPPAWCSHALNDADINGEIWIEGELNGAAIAEALLAEGVTGIAVQGIAGKTNKPHVSHSFAGRNIYVYADPPGEIAIASWQLLAHEGGADVYTLPATLFTQDGHGASGQEYDACDSLARIGPVDLGKRLTQAMQNATRYEPEKKLEQPVVSAESYVVEGNVLLLSRRDRRGNLIREPLCNFCARITQQLMHRQADGSITLHYVISGLNNEGIALRELEVPASEYPGMRWVSQWGKDAYINAGPGRQDHVRVAILSLSQEAPTTTIYHQTGWVQGPSGWVFATHGASIGRNGAEKNVNVDLTQYDRLQDYDLPTPPNIEDAHTAIRASLKLLELAPDHIAVPVLGMAYRAPLGSPRYLVLLSGVSGNGKTTFAALAQSHFGRSWNNEHLPASWLGTAFSTLTLAFAAANTLMVVDDYKPAGNTAEVLKAEGEMAKLVAATGDRAGRSRGTADGRSVQGGAYPRAALIVTGELNSQRYSDNARTVNVDFNVNLVDTEENKKRFTAAQELGASGVYSQAMAGYVQWVAQHADLFLSQGAFSSKIRDPLRAEFAGPHTRTPDNMADLAGAWRTYLSYALSCGAVTQIEAQQYWNRVMRALKYLSKGQADLLRAYPENMVY